MAEIEFAHFLEAQAPVYETVLEELKQGRKRSHWMWFIFPQIKGLGSSSTAQRYAIQSLEQAARYNAHPVLGRRLWECTSLVNRIEGKRISEIFGYPDDLKFHSCMTLFCLAAPEEGWFDAALQRYFAGKEDLKTLEMLEPIS